MPGSIFQLLTHSLTTLSSVACDLVRLLVLASRSRGALAAENLSVAKNSSAGITSRCNAFTTVMQVAEVRNLDDPSDIGDLPWVRTLLVES